MKRDGSPDATVARGGVVLESEAIVGFYHPARLWEHDCPHAHLHGDAMEGGESVDLQRRHRPARYRVIRVTVADGG